MLVEEGYSSELAKEAIKAWMKLYQSKNDDDYEFNPDKVDRMNNLIAYCQRIEALYPNCAIIRCILTPKYVQGVIELLVRDELPIGEKPETLEMFRNAFSVCDGANISPFDEDHFHITFFIEDLYVKKE